RRRYRCCWSGRRSNLDSSVRFGVVPLGEPARKRNARAQAPFHVTDELVAGVLAGEVQAPEAGAEHGTDRCDLAGSWERITGERPRVGRPIHEARCDVVVAKTGIDGLELIRVGGGAGGLLSRAAGVRGGAAGKRGEPSEAALGIAGFVRLRVGALP